MIVLCTVSCNRGNEKIVNVRINWFMCLWYSSIVYFIHTDPPQGDHLYPSLSKRFLLAFHCPLSDYSFTDSSISLVYTHSMQHSQIDNSWHMLFIIQNSVQQQKVLAN